MHRHTENLSAENAQILVKTNIQRGGRAGGKTAKASAHKGNVSKMIYFYKSTVK